MFTELPLSTIKPRFLQDVPRSVYSNSPKLKGNDEKSRLSFISMLRKGPSAKERAVSEGPRAIELNCAAWLHSNLELNQTVSLFLNYKDAHGEHLVLLDEMNPEGGHSLMLSSSVEIRVDGHIDYMKVCCSGVAAGQNIDVEELHIKGKTRSASSARIAANG